MLKDAHLYRRIILPIALAISLLFAFAPTALAASHSQGPPFHRVGPKQHYLALGDSLAFGVQPNCIPLPLPPPPFTFHCTHGYVNDLFQILQDEGTKDFTNFGCPGESSTTFINGNCPFASYAPPGFVQLKFALAYLHANPGKVSPVTLNIGSNDVLPDIQFDPLTSTCTINVGGFTTDLTTLDSNLTGTILPELRDALTVNGRITGSIVMMNYYDAFQNVCPQTVPFIRTLNQHLATDVSGFGIIVDVFGAFGGAAVPNPNICTYTWMCTPPLPLLLNIHPTDLGYSVIADTFADAIPED
jgi:lysophospholipase L1-like esterase